MRRETKLGSICVLALLLPGLVLAAPTAGSCGRCSRGAPCAGMIEPGAAAVHHSCCGDAEITASAKPSPVSLGGTTCDCGREAPSAVVAAAAPAPEIDGAEVARGDCLAATEGLVNGSARLERPPAPPSAPLIFIIDCVFLT